MPARWKVGLALLALPIGGQLWAGPMPPQDVIAGCASRAGPVPRGISALNKACPGVEDALAQVQLTAFMPPGWRQTLTARGLFDLDKLLQRYSELPPAEPPRAATLRSIAAGLAPRQAPLTWLGRIKAWIRRSPLGRWLRSLGPQLRSVQHPQAIFLGLLAFILAAVIAVLAFELRGAGLIGPVRQVGSLPRRRRPAAGSKASAQGRAAEPDWTQLRAHPARVLRLLVETLTSARRLDRDRHLTCRELETQARFETASERAGFARVALLAERELYGPPGGATVLSDESLGDARALYARLLGTAGKDGAVAQ